MPDSDTIDEKFLCVLERIAHALERIAGDESPRAVRITGGVEIHGSPGNPVYTSAR